jgi:hypothetical protein
VTVIAGAVVVVLMLRMATEVEVLAKVFEIAFVREFLRGVNSARVTARSAMRDAVSRIN